MKKIKVLQVFAKTGRGGAESMVMSHLHFIDKEKIQVDFVNHTQEHCDFDDEIKSLGGRIFHMPRFKIYNIVQYRNAWKTFFKEHPDYSNRDWGFDECWMFAKHFFKLGLKAKGE